MFEKITETITSVGKTASEKAKTSTDYAKLSIKLSGEEKTLAELYRRVGKIYYDANNGCTQDEETTLLFAEISDSIEAIANIKTQLMALKGSIACKSCGAENPDEHDFCSKCGAKIEKPIPEVVEAETEEAEEEVATEE